MHSQLLDSFLREEATEHVRQLLLRHLSACKTGAATGRRTFGFNRFNLTIDCDGSTSRLRTTSMSDQQGRLRGRWTSSPPRCGGRAVAILWWTALLLAYADLAHASGDPGVIYWAAGVALLQIGLFVFILTGRVFAAARLPASTAYLLYLFVLWSWIWHSRQSATILGAGLILLPPLAVAVLAWLLSAATRRKGEAK